MLNENTSFAVVETVGAGEADVSSPDREKKPSTLRQKRMRTIASALLVMALAIIGSIVWMFWADVQTQGDYAALAAAVHRESDGEDSIDWNAVNDGFGDAVWLQVDGKPIDFPVLQGDDNSYYLYHDGYGRSSWSSVFLDHRADRNGLGKVIYAHTLRSKTMFWCISESMEQFKFDEIGDVHYSTPDMGTVTYKPLCAMSVDPSYELVQEQFSLGGGAALQDAYDAILEAHASRGEYNTSYVADSGLSATVDPSTSKLVKTERRTISKPSGTTVESMLCYWELTDAEIEEAKGDAERESLRAWLREMLTDSTACAANADVLIDSADTSLTLACCSWPFNSTRTLIVCVADVAQG